MRAPVATTGVRAVCGFAGGGEAVTGYRRAGSHSPSCLQFDGMGCAAPPAGAFVFSTGLAATSVTAFFDGLEAGASTFGWGSVVCTVRFSQGGQAPTALDSANCLRNFVFSSLSIVRSSLEG